MGELKNSYITNAGKKMLFGGGRLTYTKASLFNQDLSKMTVEQIRELSQLKTPLLSVPVAVVNKSINKDSTTVNIEADFQNDTLKADLPFSEVGFFAKSDTVQETLIAIVIASPGAYLSAASPDSASTDAISVTLAMAIGNATKVDAVVDPAGSVTPATLHSTIAEESGKIDDKLAKKDDITDVDSKIATVNQTIASDKADSDAKAKANSDAIATKASQSDLDKTNAEVAKKADKADLDATNEAVATKADASSVYSKADLDSKLSQDLDTVNKTIASNKADSDSKIKQNTDAIATKANSADVYSKTDIDKKVDTINTAVGAKASAADLSALQATVKAQAQAIATLQATVNDQANQIAYIKANYIEGKVFPKGSEKDAVAWTKDNTQKLAIISDLKK